ncbi:unnamed protein product [Ectocarpus sp. 6 AP-2014]
MQGAPAFRRQQLHKRLPAAEYRSISSSTTNNDIGVDGDDFTDSSNNSGSSHHDISGSGNRVYHDRQHLLPHSWSISSACSRCSDSSGSGIRSSSGRRRGLATMVLGALALLAVLLFSGDRLHGLPAWGGVMSPSNKVDENNVDRGDVSGKETNHRAQKPGDLLRGDEAAGPTGGEGRGQRWGGGVSVGASGVAGSGGTERGSGGNGRGGPATASNAVFDRGGKGQQPLLETIHGGADQNERRDRANSGQNEHGSGSGSGGQEGRGGVPVTSHGEPITVFQPEETSGEDPVEVEQEQIMDKEGSSTRDEEVLVEGVSDGGGVSLAGETKHADSNGAATGAMARGRGKTEGSYAMKVCSGYLNDYGIVPEDSWGTAPKAIQKSWIKMNCDRVLGMNGFSLEDPPSRGRNRAIVVVWNNINGWLDYLRPSFVNDARDICATECVFTNDRSLLPRADGVLFHLPTFKKKDGFPKQKPPAADYVFANLEPTTYENVQPLLRDKQFMSKFDLSMTYERNSDVPLGYVGSSSTSRYFKAPKASFKQKDGFGSPDAIAAFVSNCKAAGATNRFAYMEELMKHAIVHSFGFCLHNREEPQLVPGSGATNRQENKVAVLGHYKFLLAFENNNQIRDYVTEKVYNGLQSGTLPVYWGAENVEDFVPKGSVVKASDFSSPAELGKHLKMLAANEEAYEAYFKWRDDPEEERRFAEKVISRSAYGVNAMCRLCDRVLSEQESLR